MSLPTSVLNLPGEIQRTLANSLRPKLDAYLQFTGDRPRAAKVPGQSFYTYPDESMLSDLTAFSALFVDLYGAFGDGTRLGDFAASDPYLLAQFRRIVEGGYEEGQPKGSFWHYPKDSPGGLVSLNDAMTPPELGQVLRTMRNCFAHGHWLYGDRSAVDYWDAKGWKQDGADPAFNMSTRLRDNYVAYIADANPWKPSEFWRHRHERNLRILVTHFTILRYHLHLVLEYVLRGSTNDVFAAKR